MLSLPAKTFYYWHKNILSDYLPDKENNKWCSDKVETGDRKTGEVIEKPVYVLKKENSGVNTSIDDKAVVPDGFTILSNNDTGKMAMMIESTRAEEVERAMEKFGDDLQKIKNISMDMSPTYALVFNDLVPRAVQAIDKFHVMKYVYEAVGKVRKNTVKELQKQLSKGKKRTAEDREILRKTELLRRVTHAVTQSREKRNDEMQETVKQVFENHEELKTACTNGIGRQFK